MKRLLWAVVGVTVVAVGASAEPPPSGQERTLLEQEFFLPQRSSLKVTLPSATSRPEPSFTVTTAVDTVRQWVLDSATSRLDVKRGRMEVW